MSEFGDFKTGIRCKRSIGVMSSTYLVLAFIEIFPADWAIVSHSVT